MPRKNKNARKVYKPRPTRIRIHKKPKAVLLPLRKYKKDDDISPGELKAIAEWR